MADPAEPPEPIGTADRAQQIGRGLRWASNWALRIVLIAAGCSVVGYLLSKFWSIVLPVVLGLFIISVLWPPTRSRVRSP